MRVTMLTYIDWAGSGYKLVEAISRHTENDIAFYSEKGKNTYAIPRGGIDILSVPRNKLQHKINESDVIHLKSDWPPSFYESKYKIKLGLKPIVQTVSGGLFRKRDPATGIGRGRFKPTQYKDCALRTSFEPDLLYPEYGGILTPYPIDSMGKEIEWSRSNPPVLTHNPTSERSKNTRFILQVLEKINADIRISPSKKNTPQSISIEERKASTIFFDQFGVGAYGNAACEAMQYGIPVAAWISEESLKQAPDWYRETCPVITTDRNINQWVSLISQWLEGGLEELSKETKRWCDNIHSYQAVAKQWDELYNGL